MDMLGEVYRQHHQNADREGFIFFGSTRGPFFAKVIGKSKRILDLGCRDGVLTKYYFRGNKIIGVDIDRRLLSKARKNLGISTQLFDLNNYRWPWDIGSFDVVVAGEILEHLYFPDSVVSKVAFLLTPRGLFAGSVPNSFHILDRIRFLFGRSSRGFTDPTHVNQFSHSSLRQLLTGRFPGAQIFALAGPRFSFLTKFFPSLFADDFIFVCSKLK